jgi:hypothetical protein
MKSAFFNKILLKPILSFITVSILWLIFFIANIHLTSIYLFVLIFVILIFTLLFVLYFLGVRIVKYTKFKQFPTYIDAENYYQELIKVQKAEMRIKKRELQEIKETIKKVKFEKLKEELEIRKKKVL